MRLQSSVIDFPQKELDQRLFNGFFLRRDVRLKILDSVFKILGKFRGKNWLQDIVLGGSFTTNQYRVDSDLDVGILINFELFLQNNLEFRNTYNVYKVLSRKFRQLDGIKINGVSVTFFLARVGKEYPSPGLYSVLRDYWIREPFFMPFDINPFRLWQVYFRLAGVIYNLLKRIILSFKGKEKAMRIWQYIESARERENLMRGDYNEINLIYKYLEEFYKVERLF